MKNVAHNIKKKWVGTLDGTALGERGSDGSHLREERAFSTNAANTTTTANTTNTPNEANAPNAANSAHAASEDLFCKWGAVGTSWACRAVYRVIHRAVLLGSCTVDYSNWNSPFSSNTTLFLQL
jgi:hypothetical protein